VNEFCISQGSVVTVLGCGDQIQDLLYKISSGFSVLKINKIVFGLNY